jgi:hypothetical protein
MKKTSISVILSILAIVLLMSTALAAPSDLPGSGWWSGEIIQNVGSDVAQIDITAYDMASSNTFTTSDTIPSGGNKTYLPNSFSGMPTGFQGSAIVSSNSDIRAIVNVTNRFVTVGSDTYGDPGTPSAAAGQYQGINEPDTTLVFPLVKNKSFTKTTSLYIQNAGSAAATAQVVFYMGTNGTFTYTTPSISPGAMAVVNPSAVSGMPSGNPVKGSAVATSAQPLAGTSLEYIQGESNATVVQATRGFTPADYDTKLYAPTNKFDRFGRFTGLSVQNVDTTPITVDVDYVGIAGSCNGQTIHDSISNLAPGASYPFPADKLPANCNASATITGSGKIVGTVNESYMTSYLTQNPTVKQASTVYFCLPASKATNFISAPLFKEDAFSKSTGLSIQNIGSSDAHVTLTFSSAALGKSYTTQAQTIGPGSAQVFLDVRNEPASFWNGTAMTPAELSCTSNGCGTNGNFAVLVSSDQPVVGIGNESTYPLLAPRIQQDKSNYEAFNLTALP